MTQSQIEKTLYIRTGSEIFTPLLRYLFLFLCVSVLTLTAHAQYRAGLQGSVTDADGAVIPGATVTIVDKETNQTQTVKTDAAGTFTFNRLAPALYTVKVTNQGFADKTLDNVQIAAEIMNSLNVQMALAGSNTTINVTDTAPPVDTATANIGGTISAQQLQSLPSSNRDPYQLLRLVPGSLGDGAQQAGGGSYSQPGNGGIGGSTGTGSIFQVENRAQTQGNGVRTSGNSFQIDGSQVNSLAWGGGAVITPNQESIKEVQAQTSPYDATYGRNSGSQVSVVSKNGTNQFHGSAFFKFHRPGLNAYQRYNGPTDATKRDNDRYNQIGGSIGGPIWKDHIFAFFSYEELRNSGRTQDSQWYETPSYDALVGQIKNGVSSQVVSYPGASVQYQSIATNANCAFAGLTSASCRDVTANGITGLDLGSPLRTPLGTSDPTFVNNATPGIGGGFDGIPDAFRVNTVNASNSTNQQYNGRLDWQLNPRDLIAYTVYWVPTSVTSFNGPIRGYNRWNSNRLSYTHAALWNHTFTPSLLNEFRLNAVRWHFDELTSNPQSPFGLPKGQIDNFGSVAGTANTPQQFGPPGPGVFAQTTYNLRDTVTKTWGSQNIRFGFDGLREFDNDTQRGGEIPSYSFRNLWNYANDAPYNESGNFDPRTGAPTGAVQHVRSWIFAGYVQDDWRIAPTFTVNLGIRWEYFTPLTELNNNLSNPVLGAGNNTLTDVRLKVGGDLYKSSKNNWAPQVGFAWNPNSSSTHQFVARGGFGIAYNRMQEAITLNGRNNPPLVTRLSTTCTDNSQTNCPGVFYRTSGSATDIDGYPVNQAALVTLGSNGLPVSGGKIDITAIQQNLPTPITYKTSFGVEYALTNNWVAGLGWQGSISRHYTRQNNLSWIYYQNLNPQINNFNYFSNDANANSHALIATLRRNFTHGLSLNAEYRYGKILDTGSQDYYIDQYPYDIRYAYGPADYDVKHNAKLYGTWAPKIFPHNTLLEGIFGGLQFSGILTYHTGYPWTPVYSNYSCNIVYSNSNYCTLRAGSWNGQGNGGRSNDDFKRGFGVPSLSAFTVPVYTQASGTPPPPGVGRNSLRGPNYLDTDLDAQKTFGLPMKGDEQF